jgi:hypothetical protein
MTDAERTLLIAVARALADDGRIDADLVRAVMPPRSVGLRPRRYDTAGNQAIQAELDAVVRKRLDDAIARGRMIAAAMD